MLFRDFVCNINIVGRWKTIRTRAFSWQLFVFDGDILAPQYNGNSLLISMATVVTRKHDICVMRTLPILLCFLNRCYVQTVCALCLLPKILYPATSRRKYCAVSFPLPFFLTPNLRIHTQAFVWPTFKGSIYTLKENAEALVAATRKTGLEISADKTKYMVMSRDQNAGRIHSVRTDNSTFERVEEFTYLGTNLTNQNSIAEEIKSRLKSGSACYHSVQNLFFFQVAIQKFKDQDI